MGGGGVVVGGCGVAVGAGGGGTAIDGGGREREVYVGRGVTRQCITTSHKRTPGR